MQNFFNQKHNMGFEGTINFFIDNYSEIMYNYRIIEKYLEYTKNKKHNAHIMLQTLRDRKENLSKSNTILSERDALELEESIEYYSNLREENDIIYINKEPIEVNQLIDMVLKYKYIIGYIEKIDSKVKHKIAELIEIFGSNIFTKKLVELVLNNVNIDLTKHKL